MNLKVMYVPWNEDVKELFETAQAHALQHNATHKMDQFSLPVRTQGPKSLKSVMRIQQLYIFVGWNNGCGRSVGSKKGGDGKSLNYLQLAEQLREDGLTNAIRNVKILSASDAIDRNRNHAKNWVQEMNAVNYGETSSAAYRLKEAMTQKGFTNVQVFGNYLESGVTQRISY